MWRFLGIWRRGIWGGMLGMRRRGWGRGFREEEKRWRWDSELYVRVMIVINC